MFRPRPIRTYSATSTTTCAKKHAGERGQREHDDNAQEDERQAAAPPNGLLTGLWHGRNAVVDV
jgi:hypothetical protein